MTVPSPKGLASYGLLFAGEEPAYNSGFDSVRLSFQRCLKLIKLRIKKQLGFKLSVVEYQCPATVQRCKRELRLHSLLPGSQRVVVHIFG